MSETSARASRRPFRFGSLFRNGLIPFFAGPEARAVGLPPIGVAERGVTFGVVTGVGAVDGVATDAGRTGAVAAGGGGGGGAPGRAGGAAAGRAIGGGAAAPRLGRGGG